MSGLNLQEIRTERLLLRRPRLDDAQELFEAITSDALVVRLVGWPRHTDSEATLQVLVRSDDYWREHGVGPFVVVGSDSHSIIGTTGLSLTANNCASTGYVLARAAWGRGLASEALTEMVRLATRLDITELTAFVHPQNLKSIRVLDKLKFELRSTERTEHFPNVDGGVACSVLDYVRVLR